MVVREHQVHAVELHKLSNRIVEFAQLQPILRATDRCRNGWAPLEDALASERDAMFTAGKAKGPAGSLFHTAVAAGMLGSIAVGIALLFAGSMSAPVFIALALMAARFAEPVGMLAFYVHKLSNRIVEFAQLQPILRASDRYAMFTAGKAKGPAGSLFHTAVAAGMLGSIAVGIALLFAGSMSAPVFIALALMAARFAEPVGMLAFYVDALHEAQVAMDAIEDITEAPLLPAPAAGAEKTAGAPFDIHFEGVDFSYDEGEAGGAATPTNSGARAPRQVLRDVTFTVPAGSVTAIVGPSGSGKSTLSRLTARFWDVGAGRITVGGADVRDMSEEHLWDVGAGRITVGGADVRDMSEEHLMSLMSMVFQDVYLFDTTIEENVRIGRPDASDEQVHAAAQRAALTEVIERLPQGWHTRVGEGGTALSGGERQRVALARAFLKDAPILLLDEVTSALDGVNEARVTESLDDLAQGRTVLVIAHRLSTTIRRADQIIVLTDGAVEAVGSHDELYEASPTYREFWEDQSAVARWKL